MIVEYKGTLFNGFQRQTNSFTVQQAIEDCLKSLCHHPVFIHAAGRTDTGVSATGQVIHVDLNYKFENFKLLDSLNFFLNTLGIAIKKIENVDQKFHARYSALSRTYQYLVLRRYAPSVIGPAAWHIKKNLNLEHMIMAAGHFAGTHNFNAFRQSGCQSKNPVRTLDQFEVSQLDDYIICKIKARSFLHNQVRIMVGTIVKIGLGKLDTDSIPLIISSQNRKLAGPTAPPEPLTLVAVEY